jgi:hypothetical protein
MRNFYKIRYFGGRFVTYGDLANEECQVFDNDMDYTCRTEATAIGKCKKLVAHKSHEGFAPRLEVVEFAVEVFERGAFTYEHRDQ